VEYASISGFPNAGCNAGFNTLLDVGGGVSPSTLPLGLTSASVTVTQPNPTLGGVGNSFTLASIDQGAMHVAANSQGPLGSCGGTCTTTGLRAISQADIYDTLHFTVDGSLTFTAHLDGGVSPELGATVPEYNLQETFLLGAFGSACWGSQSGVGFGPCGSQNFGFVTTGFTNQSISSFDWTTTFAVTAGESTTFFATIQADCGFGENCDLTNTASFSISGVGYTEDSGVLFSQPTSSVPEPSTLGAIGAGLIGLGILRRRRAKKLEPRAVAVLRTE
jgi:hypothetical protein